MLVFYTEHFVEPAIELLLDSIFADQCIVKKTTDCEPTTRITHQIRCSSASIDVPNSGHVIGEFISKDRRYIININGRDVAQVTVMYLDDRKLLSYKDIPPPKRDPSRPIYEQ